MAGMQAAAKQFPGYMGRLSDYAGAGRGGLLSHAVRGLAVSLKRKPRLSALEILHRSKNERDQWISLRRP